MNGASRKALSHQLCGKIDRLIMPFEALYCVWLIITLILNFKLFAYSIDAQFVLITLFYFSGWISSLVKKHKMKQ